jgi:hypothetical protein
MASVRVHQARVLLRDRRAHVTVVVLLAAFLVLGVFLWPASAHITAVTVDNGKVHLVDSKGGGPIFQITDMHPGDQGQGEVTIGNQGILPASLSLTASSVIDQPGPNGGVLSGILQLTILDVTDPANPKSVFTGGFQEGRTVGLGTLGPDASRDFRFVVAFPDGGLPPGATTGDNAYMGSAMTVDFTWTADGQQIPDDDDGNGQQPQPVPGQQAAPLVAVVPAGPVVDVPLSTTAPSQRPARQCLSRRRFTIRLRESRHRRLRSAQVVVDGHRVKVRRRHGRLTAQVNLRGIRRQTVRVKIVARTRAGRRLVGSRTYRTCTARLVGKRPPRL